MQPTTATTTTTYLLNDFPPIEAVKYEGSLFVVRGNRRLFLHRVAAAFHDFMIFPSRQTTTAAFLFNLAVSYTHLTLPTILLV